MAPTATEAEDAVRVFIEAEDCAGLVRYPYNNEDATGWYAREANVRGYGAPGRSYCAMINGSSAPEKRSMTQKLGKPIPAGNYRLFLRTKGPMRSDKESIVRVEIGDGAAEFEWSKTRNVGFVWRPTKQTEATLTKPVDTVTFTAVKFGDALGSGALYEMVGRGICIDTLYATSDLTESKPPDLNTERALRHGAGDETWPERPAYASDESGPGDYRTPQPKNPVTATPIPLAGLDGRKNLWPNSSFELGMNDGWTADNTHRGCFHVFSDRDLDNRAPFHGSYSLRVPGPKPITGVPGGYSLNPFSRTYVLEKGGPHALSLCVRGSAKVTAILKHITRTGSGSLYNQIETKSALSAEVRASAQWQRMSAGGELAPGEYALYLLSEEEFWVDAIQLEQGENLSGYAPRSEVEVGLRSGQLGNIIYRSEQDWLEAWFHNSGEAAREVRVAYRILDVRERIAGEGRTESVRVDPGKTVRRKLPLLPKLNGIFSVQFAVTGRNLPEGETVVLVMPKPAERKTRHELGANMNPTEGTLSVNSRMGLKWILTCKTFLFGAAQRAPYPGHPKGVHPEPGVWNWADPEAALIQRYGFHNLPGLWARRAPTWMREEALPRRIALMKSLDYVPKLEPWKEHVAQVTKHYQDRIKWWCIDDEVELQWHLGHLGPLIKASMEAAHLSAPGVKIGISAMPEATEELIRLSGGHVPDFFGCSSFDLNYWHSRYVRHLKNRYDRPWVCYGVGSRYPARTMYHTLPNYASVYPKAATMARRMIMLLLVQDLDVAGVYTSVIRNDAGRNMGKHLSLDKSLMDYDGTPLPWGASFAVVGTHLADAEPLAEADLGRTGRYAHVFRIGDRVGAVTWSTCVREYDHLWRPPERKLSGLGLPCARDRVEILDMYWNPLTDLDWKDGRVRLDLTEEPVFVMDKTLGEAGLRALLERATAPPEPLTIAMDLIAGALGDIDLRVSLTNNTPKPLKGVSLDLRFPGGRFPFIASGDWLLRKPFAQVPAIPPQETATVDLPTTLTREVPHEGAVVRANVRTADGLETAADQALWLIPSPRAARKPSVDGQLSEWVQRPAAWLAYDWGWALLSRGIAQLHQNGEHFGYPPYRLDARAAFWSAWDEEGLYFAVRLEDDQPILAGAKREKIQIHLVLPDRRSVAEVLSGIPGTLASLTSDRESTPVKLEARSSQFDAVRLNGAMARKEVFQDVGVEVVIPWSVLGERPKPDTIIGFDLFWTDADREGETVAEGTLRWAGQSKEHGYLLISGP